MYSPREIGVFAQPEWPYSIQSQTIEKPKYQVSSFTKITLTFWIKKQKGRPKKKILPHPKFIKKKNQKPPFTFNKTTNFTNTSSPSITLSIIQSHHRFLCCTIRNTWEIHVLFTFLLPTDWHLQDLSQSSCKESGITKNSGLSWGRQNFPEKPRKKQHTRSKPASSCMVMKKGSKQVAWPF